MACVQVSTKELSTASSLPTECCVIVELYCIRAFISTYCFWEGNLGIIYSLKLLTSISLTPNTLLAVTKCLRTALHFHEHTHGLCFGFSSLYWLRPACHISDKILRDRLPVHNIIHSAKGGKGINFSRQLFLMGFPDL